MQKTLLFVLWFMGFAFAQSALANSLHQELANVLRLEEVASILHDEGLAYGENLDASILDGKGGHYFHERVAELYDKDQIKTDLNTALNAQLDPVEIKQVISFFETDMGQRILSLENSARIAMADQAIEEAARDSFTSQLGRDDIRLSEVERFVEANDLVNRNVNSAMEANFHFYRGLANGGGTGMSAHDMRAQVLADEHELRADTTSWLYGFLLMAYKPLKIEELRSYSDFSETPTGQALNRALFSGFDQIYNTISYELGIIVAQAMKGQDI